ncbi:hypothetical protein HY797_00105 [Candidatus Falkowbacteria bacterium]|nr:hypothetical protein [Candidatus Falkowbacteria bacterium]
MTLTPEQFNKLVNKEDLRELEERIDAKIDKGIDQVLTAVDGLAKSVKDFHVEMASNQGAHDRMSDKINNHETRIGKLEYKSV